MGKKVQKKNPLHFITPARELRKGVSDAKKKQIFVIDNEE